ncbi:hypothetical protein NDI54_11065 [Haloarcula sp. S1AR25-5A]|uniref:Uncharacterized protein n=1 Tax=Haloarcula terrestris TaxID=2950533 RepID=A0AAE4EXH7_9EURY|nr:hypothetical protein [Haloarcula terrestris]MDS0221888.1 hypothetical protein [Haloarcula terrestris]
MIYESSTGEYYSGLDIWMRFESGLWEPHDWSQETGQEWVQTEAGEVLTLTPIPESELPDGLSVTEAADVDYLGE